MPDQNSLFPSQEQEQAAGFASRTMAFIVDLVIIGFALIVLFGAAGYGLTQSFPFDPEGIFRGSIIAIFIFLFLPPLFYLAYFTLLHAWSGQTVGKLLLGIRVVTLERTSLGIWRSILRSVASVVSALPIGAGFFWSVLDIRKRTWHDLFASTEVVITSNLP